MKWFLDSAHFLIVILASVALGGCASVSSNSNNLESIEVEPRILVITATDAEFDAVSSLMEDGIENDEGLTTFVEGRLGGVDVILLKGGVSIVNATMTAQWALDTFAVSQIVVSGVAAGLASDLKIGDLLVASRWGKWDEMKFLRPDQNGVYPDKFPWGEAYQFEPFDFMVTRGVRPPGRRVESRDRKFWFEVDQALLARAKQVAQNQTLRSCDEARVCVDHAPGFHFRESAVSGAVFMDNPTFGTYLYQTLGASMLEMETAAIGMVAHFNGVLYLAFRAVSDLTIGDNQYDQYASYHRLAALNAALATEAYVASFSQN